MSTLQHSTYCRQYPSASGWLVDIKASASLRSSFSLVGSCSTGNENHSQFLFGAFRNSYHGYFLNIDLLLSIRPCSSLLSTFQRLTRRSLPLRLPCPSCNALQLTQRAASGSVSSRAGFIGCSQLSQSPYVPSSSFCKACSS